MIKSLALRFLRGGIATAISAIVLLLPSIPANGGWGDLATWMQTLAFAGTVGFISGCLLAIDKGLRSQ